MSDTSDLLSAVAAEHVEFDSARRGYQMGQVDAYVEMVAHTLAARENQLSQLSEQLRTAQAQAQTQAQVLPTPVVDPTAGHTDAVKATVASMLTEASQTVLQTLADAERDADALRSSATTEAEQIVATANATSDAILADAEVKRVELQSDISALQDTRSDLLAKLKAAAEGAAAVVAAHDAVDSSRAGTEGPALPVAEPDETAENVAQEVQEETLEDTLPAQDEQVEQAEDAATSVPVDDGLPQEYYTADTPTYGG